MEFMKQVKDATMNEPRIYEQFVSILKMYQERSIPIEEVDSQVRGLFQGYAALLDNFKIFLPYHYQSENNEDARPKKIKKLMYDTDQLILPVLSEVLIKNDSVYFRRLKDIMERNSAPTTNFFLELILAFELYVTGIITKGELIGMVTPLFEVAESRNFADVDRCARSNFTDDAQLLEKINEKLTLVFNMFKIVCESKEGIRRKHSLFFKSLSDFNAVKNKKYGRSYSELQRPLIKITRGNPIINRTLISVPHGSEDYSFRDFRKNIYEDAMFKCEDEMFEADITIERTKYMTKQLAAVFMNIEGTPDKDITLDDKLFTSFRWKCIEDIYVEQATEVMEHIMKNPKKALPVVISRLQVKIEAWEHSRNQEKRKEWIDSLERSLEKSLDHRSFYFKQNEKKFTNPKVFLAEARERHEQRQSAKVRMREYLAGVNVENYDFMGGSSKKLFFNSFSRLSTFDVPVNLPVDFNDELLTDFMQYDDPNYKSAYSNAYECASLPQLRLLMNNQDALEDTLKILLLTLEKSTFSDKVKAKQLFVYFTENFLGMNVPNEEMVNGIQELVEAEEPLEIEAELPLSSLNLRENTFELFLPVLRHNSVMFCRPAVYYFLRFFYAVYERMLKAKLILSLEEYTKFYMILYRILTSQLEASKLEEQTRSVLENNAYIFFGFDKLLSSTAKSIQSMVNDEKWNFFLSLYKAFKDKKITEEVYFYQVVHSAVQTPHLFRIHWNFSVKILSITVIESPYNNIHENYVEMNRNYVRYYSASIQPTELEEDLRIIQQRLDAHYLVNDISLEDLEVNSSYSPQTRRGLTEQSRMFRNIPGSESCYFNSQFYSKSLLIQDGNSSTLCKDKTSFFQKLAESNEDKFRSWLNSKC